MLNTPPSTSYNSSYAVSLPLVASPKLPYAALRATSHSRERYTQCDVMAAHPWADFVGKGSEVISCIRFLLVLNIVLREGVNRI